MTGFGISNLTNFSSAGTTNGGNMFPGAMAGTKSFLTLYINPTTNNRL